MPEQTPRSTLIEILREIEGARPALAVAPPHHQRLTMTAWIARARATGRADEHVGRIARKLQELGRIWWPGNVPALARTTPSRRVFLDAAAPLRTWEDVAREATARLEHAPGWADEAARTPSPYAPQTMFAAACAALTGLGGPLGSTAPPTTQAVLAASGRIAELERVAAELRWLRGVVEASTWAAALGRLRAIARALGHDGMSLGTILDPDFTPSSWAHHLGRDPRREAVIAEVPRDTVDTATLLAWLISAFDVFDTDALVLLCVPCRAQILELHPELTSRRHRRRLAALQQRLLPASISTPTPTSIPTPRSAPTDASRIKHARVLFAGRRALFVSNRSFPELESRLHAELGLDCEAVASVGSPRRRHALLQRIRGGAYDLVLVAHDFSGHADTEQIAAACRSANILYRAVGKGRFTRVVSCLLATSAPQAAA